MTKTIHSSSDYIECICPKCGELHKLRMFWTGTCTPKKFCKECKNLSEACDIDLWATSGWRIKALPVDQGNLDQ